MEAEDLMKWPVIGPILEAFEKSDDDPKSCMLRFCGKAAVWTFVAILLCLTFWGVYFLAKWVMSFFG